VGGREDDGRQIWVARAPYGGGLHPGKIDRGVMYISFDGKEIIINGGYQTLVGTQSTVRWVPVSGRLSFEALHGAIPVQGGYEADGTSIFVAQGAISPTIVFPGKVKLGGHGQFPYQGEEHSVDNYNVLVYV